MSTQTELSLEQIIDFMDEDLPILEDDSGAEDPNPTNEEILKDPLDSEDDDLPEDEDEEDLENESITDETSKETEEVVATSEDQDDDPEKNQIAKFYNLFQEEGIIIPDEEQPFDGSLEAFKAAIESTRHKAAELARQSLLNRLDPEWQNALRFGLANGGSLKDFVSSSTKISSDYQESDLDKADVQRAVVRDYLKATTKHSDEKINNYINTLEKAGTLEIEARQDLLELLDLQEKEKERLAKEAEIAHQEAIKQRDEQLKEERKMFEKLIDESDVVEENRRNKLKAFVNNRVKYGSEPETSQFAKTLKDISRNPEHIVQLANILFDYDPKKGFSLDRLVKKKQTKETSKLRDKLESLFDPKTSVKGSPSGPTKDTFDWERWALSN